MNIANSPIATTTALGVGNKVGDSVGVSVLKKALNHQSSQAAQLINSIPKVENSEPHLGNNINVRA
ncbi:MAG: YjfB family protein [Gammaproteobacteria bacterium]|nr:YjfB family protein [Gammaproteobacteria bacterium]